MSLHVVVAAIAVLITSIILYFKWRYTFWKKRHVFTFPPEIPFGNAKNIILGKVSMGVEMYRIHKELQSRKLRYGGYYSLVRPVFVPVDIALVRNVLTTDFQHFTDHSGSPDEKNDPLSAHLFSLTGAKWKALRVKLTPTFTTGKLKMMFPTLVSCSDGLEFILEDSERNKSPVDIKDTFARYTTDVIASIAFGIECNSLKDPNAEFREYGRKIFNINRSIRLARLLGMIAPSLKKLLGLSLTAKDVEEFFLNLVHQTADYRDKNKVERKDFMQLLLELRNRELKVDSKSTDSSELNGKLDFYQNGLTMNEIAAQAFVFFVAGYETSSTTLNFLMYELTTNLNIQEKLREEINEVLEKHNDQITYEAISEMKYLEMCILETLRKYPALPIVLRICTKDYPISDSDVVVPKGTGVMISAYGIHHDPKFYPDPEKFDPERFSEVNKKTRPSATYLAFGEGPRICIGLRLGVLQTKVGLVNMLRKFRFTLSSKTATPLTFDPKQFILTPKGGIWVNAHRI